MLRELDGSPVKVYRLHAAAAPSGGYIAMMGANPVATAIKEGDRYTVREGNKIIASDLSNGVAAVHFIHGYFLGRAAMIEARSGNGSE